MGRRRACPDRDASREDRARMMTFGHRDRSMAPWQAPLRLVDWRVGGTSFSWAAGGAPEAPLYIGGTDFAIMAGDGRFKSVLGFINAAPAAP